MQLNITSALLAAGSACLVLAGCGDAASESATSGGSELSATGTTSLALPFSEYLLSPAELQDFAVRTENNALTCAEADNLVSSPSKVDVPEPYYTPRRYYSVLAADVSSYGLQSPEQPPATSAVESTINAMKPAERDAWYEQYMSCLRAERAQTDYDERSLRVINELDGRSFEQMISDPRVVEMEQSWSLCMAKRGFEYRDARSVFSDPEFAREAGSSPSTNELEVATAHAECDVQVDRVAVMSIVEGDYQERLIKGEDAFFNKLDAAADEARAYEAVE